MKRILFMLTAFVVLAGLVGCTTEPRGVTMHKPGVYKGEKDQLLALKNQQELIDRLKVTQSDR